MSRKGGFGSYWLSSWQLPTNGAFRANGHWQQARGSPGPILKQFCAMYGIDYSAFIDWALLKCGMYGPVEAVKTGEGLSPMYGDGYDVPAKETPAAALYAAVAVAILEAMASPMHSLPVAYGAPVGPAPMHYLPIGLGETYEGRPAPMHYLNVVSGGGVAERRGPMHYLPIAAGGGVAERRGPMHYLPITGGGVAERRGPMHYLPIAAGGGVAERRGPMHYLPIAAGGGVAERRGPMHYLPIIREEDMPDSVSPMHGAAYDAIGGPDWFPGSYVGAYGAAYDVEGGLAQ